MKYIGKKESRKAVLIIVMTLILGTILPIVEVVAVSEVDEVTIETSENEVLEKTIEDEYEVPNSASDSIEVYESQEYFEPSIELSSVVEDDQLLGKSDVSSILVRNEAELVSALENEQVEEIVFFGTNGLIDISNPVYVNRPVTFRTSTDGHTRFGGLNLMNSEASLVVTESGILTIERLGDSVVSGSARVFIKNDSGGNAALTIDGGTVNLKQKGIYTGLINISGSDVGIDIRNGGELNNQGALQITTDIGISLNNGTFEDHPDADYRQTDFFDTSYIRAREQAVFSETGTNLHNFSHNREEHEGPVRTSLSSPTGVPVYKNSDNAELTVTGITRQLRMYNVDTEGEFISGISAPDIRTGKFGFSVTQIGNDKPIINSITNQSYSHLFDSGIFAAHRGLASLSVKEDEAVDFTFRFTDTEAYVTGYVGTSTDIEIPSEATDTDTGSTTTVPVVGIDPRGLQDLGLTSVSFPETITSIGSYAFANNPMLHSVNLNENLQTIGKYAFTQSNIKEITIPNTVKDIGERAFEYSSIGELTLPDSIETIGEYAFRDNQIKQLTLPNRLKIIETATFFNNKLTTITFPESIESIGPGAFSRNDLTSLIIPDKVESIGFLAFSRNPIKTVYLGDGLNTIGGAAFSGSPVERIEASEYSIDNYKILLNTIDAMSSYRALFGVTERTYLGVSQPMYTDETSLDNDLSIGETLTLEAVSKNRYQLGDLGSYMFEPTTPLVEWYRDGTLLQNETNAVFSIENVEEGDSGRYHSVIDGAQLPDIQVKVSPIINPDIPAINPDEVGPVEPENPNPNIEALSIRYVSPLNFGEIQRSRNQQEVHSLPDQDSNGKNIPVMVTVQDMRPQSQRDGWELSVKQQGNLIDGAEIIMDPYVHESYSNELGIQVVSGPITVNQSSQVFSWTDNGNPPGIASLGLTHPTDLGVRLRIPSGVGLGSYNTTLEWTLSTGP